MNHQYVVTLTDNERKIMWGLIEKGQTQGYRIKHARILLKLNETPENQEWTYDKIKETYHATPHTICQIEKHFGTGGVEAALGRKEQVNRHKKIDGRVEAHIVAIACSEAPEGRERWTLQLIADELVRLGVCREHFRHSCDGYTEKNELKPWQKKEYGSKTYKGFYPKPT